MPSLRAAINAKCVECCCGSKAEVRRCEIETCPLWPVRPFQKKDPNKPKRPQPAHLKKKEN